MYVHIYVYVYTYIYTHIFVHIYIYRFMKLFVYTLGCRKFLSCECVSVQCKQAIVLGILCSNSAPSAIRRVEFRLAKRKGISRVL